METYQINNIDFAARNQTLKGEILLDQMQRLNELLAPCEPESKSRVIFNLTGVSKKHQLPSLHLQLEASLPMCCQRCLEVMEVPIKLAFEYVVCAEMPESIDEVDDVDWVEPSHHMDLVTLIEDELLVALPIAPLHSGECKQLKLESGERVNPFSVLKQLKKSD